jgi:hypothetical protein
MQLTIPQSVIDVKTSAVVFQIIIITIATGSSRTKLWSREIFGHDIDGTVTWAATKED